MRIDLIRQERKKNVPTNAPIARGWLIGRAEGSLNVHVELVVLGFGRLSDLRPAVALVLRLVILVLGWWRMVGSVHLVLVIVMVESALVSLQQVTWNIFRWCVGERWVAQVHQEGALVHNLCASRRGGIQGSVRCRWVNIWHLWWFADENFSHGWNQLGVRVRLTGDRWCRHRAFCDFSVVNWTAKRSNDSEAAVGTWTLMH